MKEQNHKERMGAYPYDIGYFIAAIQDEIR
ncbi:hypothetical protein FHS19_001818 [Paenibacillus rhizosphaerae]|uniref:Uncharacterized protein n=1 Tax=Paenibacillus rhizosphaerae TaxID=297318 RepID=A0A839TK42_9BACL|nr:hypothetical protein [Paenibacillus rhizosphaerae]